MKDMPGTPMNDLLRAVTRRYFFKQAGFGIGGAALSAMLGKSGLAAEPETKSANPGGAKPPMFAPKAKSVIFLFMAGAPSQVDLFDCKPKLQELNGKQIPESMLKGERFAFIRGIPKLLGSPV